MSEISINNTSLGSTLSQLLEAQSIEPGSDAGYGLCKAIWEYHPLGGKIVEKPVRLALSKPRTITIDCEPKEMLVDAFNKEWEDLGATAHIRDTMFLKRTYGASAIVYGAPDIPTTEPIDPWKLSDLNLYFNQLDPLNLAGSIVTNQNPNAPDFQKPLAYTTAAGQPYHPSRSVVVFNGTPIYLSFQSSTFGFTGRSVFQRSLYPLKSFIQSMITDDMVTYKAGLLIAKQKPAGSIVNRLMQQAANIKREYLQRGATGNVLSIDIDESIEAINLQNTDTAMKTARDNIIANIAAASDVPAILLRDEAFTQGFGEGTEDTKAIVQYVDGIREEMRTLFKFFDKIVMHRAWNKEFFEAVQNKYPDLYKNKTYEQAFYHWEKNFKADWESLMEEPESEKVKIWETKVKAINEVLRTTLPIIDPQNKAFLMQWAVDNINEMPDMFQSTLQLDADLLAEYEPPQNAMPEERMPRSDSAIGSAPVVINNSYGRHRHDADFVESDHPRGEDGKFVAGAGGGGAGGGGREVAANPAPKFPFAISNDAEHWVTLHGGEGEEGHGGSHVLINGAGEIVAGAGGKLNGQTLGGVKSKSKDVEKHGPVVKQFPEKQAEKELEKPKLKSGLSENSDGYSHSKEAQELGEKAQTAKEHMDARNAHVLAANNISRRKDPEAWMYHYEQYKFHEGEAKKLKSKEKREKTKEFKGTESGKDKSEKESKYQKTSVDDIKKDLESKFGVSFENGAGDAKKAKEKYAEYYDLRRQGKFEESDKAYSEYQQLKKGNPLLPKNQHDINKKTAAATNVRKIIGHLDGALADMQARGFNIKKAMSKGKVTFSSSGSAVRGSSGTSWQQNGHGMVAINPALLDHHYLDEIKQRDEKAKQKGELPWSVHQRTNDDYMRSTIVHEVAHALGINPNVNSPAKLAGILTKLSDEGKLKGNDDPPQMVGWNGINHWIKNNISQYAAKNIKETDAELCAYVTAPGYVEGSLPKELEDHVYELFGKK